MRAIKNKTVMIILILFLVSSASTTARATEQSSQDGSLTLDPNALTDRKTEEFTALGDLYGLSVFSDDFIEKEASYKKLLEEQDTKILLAAINKENKKKNYDKIVNAVLSSADAKVIKENYNQSNNRYRSLMLWLYCIFGGICLLGIGVLLREKFMQKRSRSNEGNFDHYDIEDESILSNSSSAKSKN